MIAVSNGRWEYDQPAIRLASKHCNCALDFAGIVNTSRLVPDRAVGAVENRLGAVAAGTEPAKEFGALGRQDDVSRLAGFRLANGEVPGSGLKSCTTIRVSSE
jgi:hypothetical protein